MNNVKESTKSECPVCFENINLETLSCNHQVCISCKNKIGKINNKCPLCRCSFTIKKLSESKKYFLNDYGYKVTPEKYLATFYDTCLNQNHKVKIDKPYGVLLSCLDCGKVKSYNWMM